MSQGMSLLSFLVMIEMMLWKTFTRKECPLRAVLPLPACFAPGSSKRRSASSGPQDMLVQVLLPGTKSQALVLKTLALRPRDQRF